MSLVAIHTLGCKLNFSESSTIVRQLEKNGFTRVDFTEKADIYIINTCSVTDNADKKCRNTVKGVLKQNPNAYVVVIGCYAQLKPKEISNIPGVDMVLGAAEKFNMIEHLHSLEKETKAIVHNKNIKETRDFVPAYSMGDRTRSFLKVQDGCDYKCTYCTIPLARGISRSDKLVNIVNAAKSISSSGVKEIVLTGVNIGDYGKGEFGNKNHENTFLDLVSALDKVDGISRIRISSIEPNLLSNEIIDFVSTSNKFVPHFHIPMQSGSDSVLKLMKRRYLSKLYKNRIDHIKKVIPNACIGADVIVGFPGETEEDFLETYNFIKSLNLSYLHVFTYSERDNTEAIKLKNIVSKNIRSKRSKSLRSLSVQLKRKFYKSQLGNTKDVLFETENRNGFIYGFSNNYVRVKSVWRKNLADKIVSFDLEGIDNDGLVIGKKTELKIKV